MRITLKQIAQETGVSVTTVSLVLNNKDCRVSEVKKELIKKTAKSLKYRPNMLAVGLVKGSTKSIGLIISDIRNYFFANLAKGIEDECQRNGWNMILCNSNDIHKNDIEYIKMMADKGVDGIIFGMASETTDKMALECVDLLESENIPYLLVDRFTATSNSGIVCVNHELGGYLGTEYLIKLGHKKIAAITGPLNLLDARERIKGYRKALDDYNIDYDDNIVIEGKYTYQSGIDGVKELYDRKAQFSAIFASNDMMAIGATREIKNMKIKVPDEVSIIGYDDILLSSLLDVPLTTIRQPALEMGEEAAKLIIEDNIGTGKVVFDPKLVIRESTKAK